MVELVALLFLALPVYVGYRKGTYTALVVPVAFVVVAVLGYVSSGSSDAQPADDTDVIPGVYLVAAVVGLLLCPVGVALGRRR